MNETAKWPNIQLEPTSGTLPRPLGGSAGTLDSYRIMKTFLIASRVICGFLGFVHLFGQLFFSNLEVAPTISGLSGLMAAILSGSRNTGRLLPAVCVAGVLAILSDAYSYYSSPHAPGNYYAWPEAVLFAVVLLLLANHAWKSPNGKSHEAV